MYLLTPPTETFKAGTDRLWGRVPRTRSRAIVVYSDGRIITTLDPPSAGDSGIETVWPGGRTYEISDESAALLTEAGYAAHLEVVA